MKKIYLIFMIVLMISMNPGIVFSSGEKSNISLYFPYTIGLFYNGKTSLNLDVDLFLPRRVGKDHNYINNQIIDGPFLNLNIGTRAIGAGFGYGLFIRCLGTIATSFKMRGLYCYQSSSYIDGGYYYLNSEFQQTVFFNTVSVGYLRALNKPNDTRNLFYLSWGIKI